MSSSTPTQDKRIAELTTPLGKDKLLLARLDVAEGLSQLFETRIECVSKEEVDLGGLIGQTCGVRLKTVGRKTRYFSGVCVEASWAGEEQGMAFYRLVMRPWTWLLSQAADSRIFQNKSAPDIIREVFTNAGFTDYEF